MNTLMEKVTGLAPMTDQVIATDMLIAAKSGIKNYAFAITESATPEVRQTLSRHLEEAIEFHQQISKYMIEKGYYMPHDTKAQNQIDMKTAETALQLAKN
ncbi:spore coat protein [Bacillus alkalicellulosilyticus]|uniref:spore coat protein n=1 Tax=Alkalihalobacterium alkalicellulosilyticum TaxID=1912214 RepID=UPI00099681A8|nr:spore coat protein [Bacillus alkalicellulosilyticus]